MGYPGAFIATLTPRLPLLLLVISPGLLGSACDPPPDTCQPTGDIMLSLGSGVGGAFQPFQDGQAVGLDVAPQGGFGVSTLLLTTGMLAGDEEEVEVQLDTRIDGDLTGSFLLEGAALLCRSDGQGGMISGVVVGFDPDVYRTDDDLLLLNGQNVSLDVTITDTQGRTASAQQPVMVVIGNQ